MRVRASIGATLWAADFLQRSYGGLELGGDFVGWRAGPKSQWLADAHDDFAYAGEAAVFALHLPDTVQADRENRDLQILREQADARLEFRHFAGDGIVHLAFGEDEDAVAAVDRLAGEAEAFAESGELRKREDVEERRDEPIAELVCDALGGKPILRRVAHVAEGFAAHGGREVVSIAGGQRSEDQADVGAAGDVIGDDEEWSECVAKIFAAAKLWVAQDFGGWPHEGVVDGEAEKAERFALRPARVDVGDAAGLGGRVRGAGEI